MGPVHVFDIRGGEFPLPVVTESEALDLAAYIGNIAFCCNARMRAGFNRILLRRQSESVITPGMQYVVSLHPLIAGIHVCCAVTFRMAHVQSLA